MVRTLDFCCRHQSQAIFAFGSLVDGWWDLKCSGVVIFMVVGCSADGQKKYSILYIRGELHTFRKDSGGTSVIMQWVEPDSLLTLSRSEKFLVARGKDAN